MKNIAVLALLLLAVWAFINFQVALYISAALMVLALISWILRRGGDNRLWSPKALFVIGICFAIWFVGMNLVFMPFHITATPYVPSPRP